MWGRDLPSPKLRKDPGSTQEAEAVALNKQCVALMGQRQYRAAEPVCLQSLEAALGPNHRVVAAMLSFLARALRLEGREKAAEALFERALKIDVATPTTVHSHLLRYSGTLRDDSSGAGDSTRGCGSIGSDGAIGLTDRLALPAHSINEPTR